MRFRRIVSFRAKGGRLIEFMNAVRHSDIICLSQRCGFGEYTGKVYYTDLEMLKTLAAECSTDIFIDTCEGSMFKVMKYRTRYGIIIGIVFMALFIFFMSNTVVAIEINGTNKISDGQVLSLLKETGLKKGAYIPSLDLNESEMKLQLSLEDAGWLAIRSRGGKIIVDIHEKEPAPETLHSNIPCNIVSTREAQIVSIEVNKGDKMVRAGDAVAKGDIIISGIITNEENNFVVCHAAGEVIGEYSESQHFVRYFNDIRKVYTRKISRKYFEFFGFRIPLFIGDAYGFTADYSEKVTYFEVFGAETPMGIVDTEYDVYDMREVSETKEQALSNLKEQALLYERNFYSDCEIVNKRTKVSEFDDRLEYDVEYIVKGNIAVEKEIFVGKE